MLSLLLCHNNNNSATKFTIYVPVCLSVGVTCSSNLTYLCMGSGSTSPAEMNSGMPSKDDGLYVGSMAEALYEPIIAQSHARSF